MSDSTEALRQAAKALIDEVDRRHDNDDPPQRYMVPYGHVVALRTALAAVPAPPRLHRQRSLNR